MQRMAKKVLIVLCMLVVTTAQLLSHASAMQMDQTYPSPVQSTPSHAMHTKGTIGNVAQNCCEQSIAEKDAPCSEIQIGEHDCKEMTDCAQSQCTNPVGAGLPSYSFDTKKSVLGLAAINDLLLPQKSSSLYRPPISH